MAFDPAPLAARLTALNLATAAPVAADTPAVPLHTYFFRPKSGSKTENKEADLTLVVITIEDGKDVGSANIVAKKVGLKEMRAITGAQVVDLIGASRELGEFGS